MATLASFLSSSPSLPRLHHPHRHPCPHRHGVDSLSFADPPVRISMIPRKGRALIAASSSAGGSSIDDLGPGDDCRSVNSPQKSVLSTLIQEIEPLDVSLIQKDVAPTTIDAMKRTISGMLGLLPSNQFQVYIEALWEPLSKLLVSSMMTGYTLRNAEYRLCLERNRDTHEQSFENRTEDRSQSGLPEILLDSARKINFSGKTAVSPKYEKVREETVEDIKRLGKLSREAQEYIVHLQSRLSSAKKELHEVKRKSAALQMQQFVGEEKNELLDYLRSLEPEKVAELSEPSMPELRETIHSVVHGLLATLSPRMHSKGPPLSECSSNQEICSGDDDHPELVENVSLQFQPIVSLTRDYLARLLFWCMLLGHHLRGLEYRLELAELLSLTVDAENDTSGSGQVS
ncbi:uncharacterized protein LOC115757160 [Rhodamnia argentea]|uniref:Uncharacterized protein LOC115757160 n=1 Tax=Rhodamnia argentea TaxID=178133 RepID=A0A8B8R100_9MYRT|nr:uncharacterized protein LOC115757160 [Rhodamnia argentea]